MSIRVKFYYKKLLTKFSVEVMFSTSAPTEPSNSFMPDSPPKTLTTLLLRCKRTFLFFVDVRVTTVITQIYAHVIDHVYILRCVVFMSRSMLAAVLPLLLLLFLIGN